MSEPLTKSEAETAALLKHLQFERQDLTAVEVCEVLSNGWKKVPGRTHRQLLIQLLDVLLQNNKLQQRQLAPGSEAWIDKTMEMVENIADAEHANGKTVGRLHRDFLREHLAASAAQMVSEQLRENSEAHQPSQGTELLPTVSYSGPLHKRLIALADILKDCGRLVSKSGNAERVMRDAAASLAQNESGTSPQALAVWFGPLPESDGKSNWTAILHRAGGSMLDGISIARSEHKDRVQYEADRVRHLIGELPAEPDILAYDPDLTAVVDLAPVRRIYLVATGETHEGQETYTRHEDSPPPLCDFEALFSRPVPAQPAAAARRGLVLGKYSFNCTSGCGECGIRLREFEHYRSETHEGVLIERKTIPEIVSTCCGHPVEVWDSEAEDTCAQVLAATPQHLSKPPTIEDVVAYIKGGRSALHELIDDMVRRGVAKARGDQLTARAEKTVAWEVDQAGQVSLLSVAEFTKRSFDTGAMRPLVYGDTPARVPLSDFELECLHIGQAVQRAAEVLPEAYELQVLVEKGAGTLRLCGPDDDIPLSDRDGGLSSEIDLAIDTAIQHAKAS